MLLIAVFLSWRVIIEEGHEGHRGHRALTLNPASLRVALHVASTTEFLENRLAAATFAFSVGESGVMTITAGFLVASCVNPQKVEYGVAFVGRMLETIAMAGGAEGYFASSGEGRAFVFVVG